MPSKTYKMMHFFKLRLYTLDQQENEADTQRFLNNEEVINYLDDLIANKLGCNSTIPILKELENPSSEQAVLEIIEDDKNYVFGKIGREKDINAFQIRNTESMASEPIPKEQNEIFEAFSYFYIDKNTCFVGYLFEQSAPNISYLGKMFTNEYRNNDNIFGQMDHLLIEDALPILKSSEIIGTIDYSIALPVEQMPVDMTGLSEREYEKLTNQKEVVIDVKLKAKKRKQSVFNSNEHLESFFNNLKNLFGLRKTKVQAKETRDALSQTYTLNNDAFTKRIDFDYGRQSGTQEEIQTAIGDRMKAAFKENRPSLNKYISN